MVVQSLSWHGCAILFLPPLSLLPPSPDPPSPLLFNLLFLFFPAPLPQPPPDNAELGGFAENLEAVCIETREGGCMTKDLASCIKGIQQ